MQAAMPVATLKPDEIKLACISRLLHCNDGKTLLLLFVSWKRSKNEPPILPLPAASKLVRQGSFCVRTPKARLRCHSLPDSDGASPCQC